MNTFASDLAARRRLIFSKVTADGRTIVLDAEVFAHIATYWSVSDNRTGEVVAFKDGFASVEEAAASCAEWLSANGYSIR